MRTVATLLASALTISGCVDRIDAQVSGVDLYLTYCAACHGTNGEGDGPVASVMVTQVPNLRLLSERNGGMFPADSVAEYVDGRTAVSAHGDRQMPVWGEVFSWEEYDDPDAEAAAERRIAAIVDFIAEIQY